MKVWATVEMDFRGKEAKRRGIDFIHDYILDQTALVEEYAKFSVSPGVGPGPHPHRTEHEDTGALRDSITSDVDVKGTRAIGEVGTDLEYGAYLEVGWHSRAGRFFRYPWLEPSLRRAKRSGPKVAQRHAHVYFRGDLTSKPQRIQAGYIPPGIRWEPFLQRFRGPGGRFISREKFEALLAQYHAEQGIP